MKKLFYFLFSIGIAFCIFSFNLFKQNAQSKNIPFVLALKRDLKLEIRTMGELEAARSMTIASSIKGDLGKIIDLVGDGIYVKPGEILVRLDPTPFEEKLEKLNAQIREQQSYLNSLEQTLEWEIVQAEHKNQIAHLEVEAAQLELEKIRHGDGPQEISRLKAAMQKALLKYDELKAYSNDLQELESQGFLNTMEVKHAQKKLTDEEESYAQAKQQYETYAEHVLPMLIKKAETHLHRAEVNQQEISNLGLFNIAKSKSLLDQSHQTLADLHLQQREAEKELELTEIKAPAPGMVVLRDEYRSGQKRKPRIGDILVKNQPLIDLPDLSSMIVKTRVREVDLYKVGMGKKASIEVDAYPQLSFQGTVKSIGVLALTDVGRPSEEKYFEVRIVMDQSDPRLRPGMTTRVTIHSHESKGTLTIPLHTVFDDQKQSYCYVCRSHHGYEKKSIALGLSNDQWVEIKEGLQEGDCVCLINPFNTF